MAPLPAWVKTIFGIAGALLFLTVTTGVGLLTAKGNELDSELKDQGTKVAKLEAHYEHIEKDLGKILDELREIRKEIP